MNGRPQDFHAPKLKPGRLTIVMRRDLTIPAALNVPVIELYRLSARWFLEARRKRPPDPPPIIKTKRRYSGPSGFTLSPRALGGPRSSRRRLQVCLCLMLICGVVWAVCGGTFLAPPRDVSPWLPLGIMSALCSGLFWLLAATGGMGSRIHKRLKDACLIISPSGIALVQGDVKGQLRWNELQDIRYCTKARNFAISYETDIRGIPEFNLSSRA